MLLLGVLGCADVDAPETDARDVPSAVASDDELASTPDRIEKGGSANSCIFFWAAGTGPLGGPNSIGAQCLSATQDWVQSEVWLPGCMGNDNGRLVWGGRYFDRSCRNCAVSQNGPYSGAWFACDCQRADGRWTRSGLGVSDYLTNRNGYLTCD
jgi:hypothetical protein